MSAVLPLDSDILAADYQSHRSVFGLAHPHECTVCHTMTVILVHANNMTMCLACEENGVRHD
jgi:hypothetical protein